MTKESKRLINDVGTVVEVDDSTDVDRYLAAGYAPLEDDDYPMQQHEVNALPEDHPMRTGGVPATIAADPGGKQPKARTAKQLGIS